MIKLLAKRGANVNAQTFFKETPLLIACQIGLLEIVAELLQVGANVSLLDHSGNTPLQNATDNGHQKIGDL